MRNNKFKFAPLFAAILFSSSGCAISPLETVDYESNQTNIEQAAKGLPEAIPANRQMTVRDNQPWVSVRAIDPKAQNPVTFEKQVTVNEPNPVPVESLQNKIERVINIPVRIENDVLSPRQANQQSLPGTTPLQNLLGQMNAANQQPGVAQQYGATQIFGVASNPDGFSQGSGKDTRVTLSYKGSVKGLLDAFSIALKAKWRYDAPSGTIVIYRYETKTFRLAALPGKASSNSTVAVSGKSSGGGAASATFQGQLSIWESMAKDLSSLKTDEGSVSVSEATGVITITDLPEAVERVGNYIDRLNKTLNREVVVDVKIYRVAAEDIDKRAVNLEGLFQSVGLNASLNTPRGDVTGLSSLTLSIPETALGNRQHFIGSQVYLESLSKLGRTSTMIDTSVRTVNNQPAPIRAGKTIAYLKETATTVSQYGNTVALTPGEVDVGFNMQVLPTIQDNGSDVLLQISMTLSVLDALKEFKSGTSTIQLPEVSSRDFMQRVWLRSGESLVLANLNQEGNSLNNEGLVHGNLWFLSGKRDSNQLKEMLVIVITPVVGGV